MQECTAINQLSYIQPCSSSNGQTCSGNGVSLQRSDSEVVIWLGQFSKLYHNIATQTWNSDCFCVPYFSTNTAKHLIKSQLEQHSYCTVKCKFQAAPVSITVVCQLVHLMNRDVTLHVVFTHTSITFFQTPVTSVLHQCNNQLACQILLDWLPSFFFWEC